MTPTKPTIDEVLAPKPEADPRIYAYSIDAPSHEGLLKVGQTTRSVQARINEQLGTAAIGYTIVLDESAARPDGSIVTDHQVRAALVKRGHDNPQLEWMRCKREDVLSVLQSLKSGKPLTGARHQTFAMRAEQADAVEKTLGYFDSIWDEDPDAAPRFLWNAKMRFGKTFTTYQLARRMEARRVLVLTFKPAVADAWQSDLDDHVDFEGWQFHSRTTDGDPTQVASDQPLVYFGSFQDLLGRDPAGNIKPRNEWLHVINWDLVVFDEYHFGAWRETAQGAVRGRRRHHSRAERRVRLVAIGTCYHRQPASKTSSAN